MWTRERWQACLQVPPFSLVLAKVRAWNAVRDLRWLERIVMRSGAGAPFFSNYPSRRVRQTKGKGVKRIASIVCVSLIAFLIPAAAQGDGVEDGYPPKEERHVSPGNTVYYIDPAQGDDTHSGVSKRLAWRTFGPVNRLLLSPGDRVEVVSPGSFDHTLMLMGSGTAEKPVEVLFAPGRYDWFPANALRRTYHISNTNAVPDVGKAIGILLEGASHFKISGPGAILYYRGKMVEVCLDHCENITVSDLCFDYHRPTVSEYRVVAVDADHVDLEIHKDSAYKVENGRILWVGEGWSHESGLAQELDVATNEIWRLRDPLSKLRVEEIGPFLVRAHGQHGMKPGRVYQIRATLRDCAGVFTRRSKNITWRNLGFRFLHGMGMVTQYSENITFEGVTIAPSRESRRTSAAWADCLQVSGCRGKIRVENCVFSGAHDDAINIHGTYLRVVERLSAHEIKVRFSHRQTYGFMAFGKGDEVTFVRWDALKLYGPNTVRDARLLNPKEIVLTLEKPVPADLRMNDAVENVTWTPEVEIRGCTISRIPTRGFLIATRRKVLVEKNDFRRTHMSAILVGSDAKVWYESGCVRDMTIRNNTFSHCGEPVIRINPENSVPNNAVHRNIRIEENKFVLRKGVAVGAKSTQGLNVVRNVMYAKVPLDDKRATRIRDCSGVNIENNRFLPLPAEVNKADTSDGK